MKKLVFIGGGHSHVIAMLLWGKKSPIISVEKILISDVQYAPYSGMLPGLIAGYYSYQESHINLQKLAEFSGYQLIIDRVINIEPDSRQVICQSGKIIDFDLLSIDIGSTPAQSSIRGADVYGIPAKPIPYLLEKWQQILERAAENPHSPLSITIVGGGAGGVELAFHINERLTPILASDKLTINVIHRGQKILSGQHKSASNLLTKSLSQQKINLYLQTEIKTITSTQVLTKFHRKIVSDFTFLVTQAQAPKWLEKNLISTDKNGFILIKKTLQTINYNNIFATGDIATMPEYPRPKAGVFAVKQGKPLFQNICKHLSNQPLISYKPQHKYLNIIGISQQKAVGIWGEISYESPILWYLKQWLDLRFMNQFNLE